MFIDRGIIKKCLIKHFISLSKYILDWNLCTFLFRIVVKSCFFTAHFLGSTNSLQISTPISTPKTPSDLNLYMIRNDENIPTCGICFKFSNKTTTCVRNHIEAIHFPNIFTYSCPICTTQFNTKNALYNHKAKCKLQGEEMNHTY